MSRILLLVLFVIWMAGPPLGQSAGESWPDLFVFFSFYIGLVSILGLWSRALARRVAADNFHRNLRRFNQVMFAARVMVPVWFTVGVWGLGWGALIDSLMPSISRSALGMLLGTLPAFAAWMGLWWSQYPADRALREQNLLVDLDNDLPLYQPPSFRSYFLSNFRLQVLFTLLPIALVVLIRDGLVWSALRLKGLPWNPEPQGNIGIGSLLISSASIFLFAPALLRRVLNTSPMPDTPLRRRLDLLCQRAGVRYRQILIWDTNNHIGNAAVMGILPWLRYVLLTDVLLERMTDEEIEAVFAHELGHIVHRHMTWYALFVVIGTFVVGALDHVLTPFLQTFSAAGATVIMMAGMMLSFLLVFGALSRRCERQADVFAARTMEMLKGEEPLVSEGLFVSRQLATLGAGPLVQPGAPRDSHVGRYGAWLFAAALRRVATINNIPINPRTHSPRGLLNQIGHWLDTFVEMCNNWLHGSIASRMQYLQDLSADPRRTTHFDRTMFWLYCGLLFALFVSALFFTSVTPK